MEGYGFEAYESQNEKATEEDVKRIFSEAADKGVYPVVSCVIDRFDDFKVRWARQPGVFMEWHVSDYLVGMPIAVVEDLASTVKRKIDGETDAEFSDRANDYLVSDEARDRVQATQCERKMLKVNVGGFKRYIEQASMNAEVPSGIVAKYGQKYGYSVIGRIVVVPNSLKGASQNVKWALFNDAVKHIIAGIGAHDVRETPDPVKVELTREEACEIVDAGIFL